MDHHHMHGAMNHSMGNMQMGTTDMMNHNNMNHMMDISTAGGHGGHGGHDHVIDTGVEGECATYEMLMYFHTGVCEYVLFESLYITSVGGMVGACIGIFFLAMMYEALKVFREYLLRRLSRPKSYNCKPNSAQDTMVMDSPKNVGYSNGNPSSWEKLDENFGDKTKPPPTWKRMLSLSHLVQTLMHVIQIMISYFLMLIFMTYNAWMCIAIALGAGAGYFAFGWKRAVVVDVNEHCH